jgi:hypothetical protein
MSKKSLMHSIKMYDATDLMPKLMRGASSQECRIHSTAGMYAARRRNVSQLKKTLGGTHAVAVLRYQSALYATIIKTRSDSKATADSEYAALIKARSRFNARFFSAKLIRAHRSCIKARSDNKATAESESEHSTEGEHQFHETSEDQSMTDTTMTQPTATVLEDIMECTLDGPRLGFWKRVPSSTRTTSQWSSS